VIALRQQIPNNAPMGILMRRFLLIFFAVSMLPLRAQAKVVVFWQPGFPTVDSHSIERTDIDKALEGLETLFANEASLASPETLANADLLALPYGSAVPAEGWKNIKHYLDEGGNLLVIGGQPLRAPVSLVNQQYLVGGPQDTYSRVSSHL
jgi:hypothetical protein